MTYKYNPNFSSWVWEYFPVEGLASCLSVKATCQLRSNTEKSVTFPCLRKQKWFDCCFWLFIRYPQRCELCPHKDGALKRTDNGGTHTTHTCFGLLAHSCFFFYGVHVAGKFRRREHTARVMLVFVVCVASTHHPCQSVFYDCVYVYEGADQDAYSARPVRSLLVGFTGRSGWWRL